VEEGCYYIDFEGRQVLGHPTLFSGCCTLFRLDAVARVGWFTAGHLTEDLDLTDRLWLDGWKGVYLEDVINYGEVPFPCSKEFVLALSPTVTILPPSDLWLVFCPAITAAHQRNGWHASFLPDIAAPTCAELGASTGKAMLWSAAGGWRADTGED
jgi:cellulose synthase/poly-beta-1,6-N-acetylglucosamine synthase-like glycosyltransferase